MGIQLGRNESMRRRLERSNPIAGCTIVSRNYLSHARILASSFLEHEPNGRFYVLVVDRLLPGASLPEGVVVLGPDDLELPYLWEMCFKYDVTELCTAVKPTLLKRLFERGERRVAYFDPDIWIGRPMSELRAALGEDRILLTPHLLTPIPQDGRLPSEADILVAGAYNLGFIALGSGPQTDAYLDWWESRLRDGCRVDPARGLMVDQRWVDLVPTLFPGTDVLRDVTYNVAYWNLHEREVTRAGDRFLVQGRPLAFFHFSGFDPLNPLAFSRHQTRFRGLESTPLGELLEAYAERHLEEGFEESRAWGYGYATFSNNLTVHALLRQLYLGLQEEQRLAFGDPFDTERPDSFLTWATTANGNRGLSPFLDAIHRTRYDVASTFPDVGGKDRTRFLKWAREKGALEMGYSPELVPPPAAMGDPATVTSISNGHGLDGAARSIGLVIGGGKRAQVAAGSTRLATAVLERPKIAAREGTQHAAGPPGGALPGVNVCGYLRNESGLGAAARGYIRALRTAGVQVGLKDVSHLSVNRSEDVSLGDTPEGVPHPVNLVCINADQHFVVAEHLEDFFEGRYNIGVWAWELPGFPEEWLDRFAHYDEIWVGSSFIANALGPISPVPVVRVPPPLGAGRRGSRERGRKRLGVASDEFLFTFVFDFHSYAERKNPLGAIQAFRAAFDPGERVRLVVKCVNQESAARAFDEMQEAAQGHRVSIQAGYWRDSELRDLMAACDAYVSLHRSEGTGLTITEAMALGKPIIATGWSGNMDFMTVANSFPVEYRLIELDKNVGPYRAGQVWADPSIEHAAEMLRRVTENRDEAGARAARAASDIDTMYSERAIAAIVRRRLEVIGARLTRGAEPPAVPDMSLQPGPRLGYRQLVGEVRRAVREVTPEGAVVVVVSRGDPELVDLDGRLGWHFPRQEDGEWPGYYPKEDGVAVAHLESLRSQGARFFVLPSTAFWWLDHYPSFAAHLDAQYRVVRGDESCRIYDLEATGERRGGRMSRLLHHGRASAASAEAEAPPAHAQAARFTQQLLKDLSRRLDDHEARLDTIRGEVAAPNEAVLGEGPLASQAAHLDQLIRDLASRVDGMGRKTTRLEERADRQRDRIAQLEKGRRLGSHDSSTVQVSIEERRRRNAARLAAVVRTLGGARRVLVLAPRPAALLDALAETEVTAEAVVTDPSLARRLQKKGVDVHRARTVTHLRSRSGRAPDGIVLGGMLDKLQPPEAVRLLTLCRQKLATGGVLILEGCVLGSRKRKRLPLDTATYLVRAAGFGSTRTLDPGVGDDTRIVVARK
jgi:glycosyltransferase involved in cell wall biosynthesis